MAECCFGEVLLCVILRLPFLPRLLKDVLAKPFVLRQNWNFGISTGYPQAKYLILKEKTTIPEKIPLGIKLYKLGIFVVLWYIWTWNWLEPHEPKDTLRNE